MDMFSGMTTGSCAAFGRNKLIIIIIIEEKILGKAAWGRKGWSYCRYDGRERLWTVERFNLSQIKMETDRIASENACQKPVGNSKRLEKRRRCRIYQLLGPA